MSTSPVVRRSVLPSPMLQLRRHAPHDHHSSKQALVHLSPLATSLSGPLYSAPITSLEWSPHESSMLLSTGEDGQTAVWDLALERDPEEEAALAPETNAAVPDELPPQLLFVHAGQRDVKEGHWHAQIPGLMVTTAADGFNLFKPANV